ncbi:MAG: hypothetical protein PHW04_18005 [Candidatus Wallbacteria bacterium]|nr:hypothetical protein [Candidatus Wallbacteria bacterium]
MKKGVLLLTLMVFIAIIGLGAIMIIPPIEKQGRGVLEQNYEGTLIDFYRSFHDYLNLELNQKGSSIEAAILKNTIFTTPIPLGSPGYVPGATGYTGEVILNKQNAYLFVQGSASPSPPYSSIDYTWDSTSTPKYTGGIMNEMVKKGYITKRRLDKIGFPDSYKKYGKDPPYSMTWEILLIPMY